MEKPNGYSLYEARRAIERHDSQIERFEMRQEKIIELLGDLGNALDLHEARYHQAKPEREWWKYVAAVVVGLAIAAARVFGVNIP